MYAKVLSLGIFGMDSFSVIVEADLSQGLPRFDIVGLPDAGVKESKERVRSSIKNLGFEYPVSRITVNIAPADIKKEGSVYDLPILIALLKATKQIMGNTEKCAFIGELSLDGEIRGCRGVLPMLLKAKEENIKTVFVPLENKAEASVVDGVDVFAVANIIEVVQHFSGEHPLEPCYMAVQPEENHAYLFDFADVRGQECAKRALEIAAAGGHNCLMIGSPGTGKSMLAKRLPTILPEMTFNEKLETTKIYSIAGELQRGERLISRRPFRSPHHTVSAQGFTGGGNIPKPGEISLAHNGVLFMDEFPEFDRRTKESLRQPLEDGKIVITRTGGTVSYPSNLMIVAAMNPCPCGYRGSASRRCTCSEAAIKRYKDKVSGPMLDRIDIHIELENVDYEKLSSDKRGEPSAAIRARVNKARSVQTARFAGTGISCNAKMTPKMTRDVCVLGEKAAAIMKKSFVALDLSPRAYDKILRISRTIADLDGSESIESEHIFEAIRYRSLDRKYWGA